MTVLKMKVGADWIPVGGTPETVWTGPSAPTNPDIDLWVDTDEEPGAGPTALGECRLVVVSGTSLRLEPFNGRRVLVNGRVYLIPAAGLTVSNAGLAAGQYYVAYLHDTTGDGTAVQLKLSTGCQGFVDPATGVRVVSFDGGATGQTDKTYVGLLLTTAASQFATAKTASWFNRRFRGADESLTTTQTGLSSSTLTAFFTTSAHVGFAGDHVFVGGQMGVSANASNTAFVTGHVMYSGASIAGSPAIHAVANTRAEAAIVPTWLQLPVDTSFAISLGIQVWSGGPVTIEAYHASIRIQMFG